MLRTAAALSVLMSVLPASAGSLDYERQNTWQSLHDKAQSPIDIRRDAALEADPEEPRTIDFRNTRARLEVVDNGHAIEVETQGPDAMIRGRHFELAQFHFHATSEHTIDGEHFPLEGHFVFRARDGRLAVVGVMYRDGDPNPLADEVLEALDESVPDEIEDEDLAVLLPGTGSYHHYLGSLTTPPLTENVEWYVYDEPVSLSSAQIAGFTARYSHNNRTVQPLNGRPVVHFGQN